jgi:hypothetical protein
MAYRKFLFTPILIVMVLAQIFGLLASPDSANASTAPSFSPHGLQQDGSESKCWPLDVVMVVDQSHSMFDPIDSKTPSDPNGYRIIAAKEVLTELIKNRQERCSQAVHRFAFVEFGSTAIRSVPLTRIDLSPADDAKSWSEEMNKKIELAGQDQTQNYTDFNTGFNEIIKIYSDAEAIPAPDGYGPRRKIVIFITDGMPTTAETMASELNFQNYMRDFKSSFNNFWDDFHIWFVALNAGYPYLDIMTSGESTLRQDLSEISASHKGELQALTYNEQAIPAFVSDIVSKEFGSTGVAISCNQKFYIDPYSQRAEFRFFRRKDETQTVTLSKLDENSGEAIYSLNAGKVTSASGVIRDMEMADYYVSDNGIEERYVIDNPLPGGWKFSILGMGESDCQRSIEARKYSFLAEVKVPQSNAILPVVDAPPFFDSEENKFQVLLKNSNTGKPVTNFTEYPINVTAVWKLPSGSPKLPDGTDIIPLQLTAIDGGIWVSSVPVLTPELGVYTYSITGTAPSGDKSTEINVFSVEGKFEAKKIESLVFNVVSPDSSMPAACNKFTQNGIENDPLGVTIQVLDNAGNPVSTDDLFISEPNNSFVADVSDKTGIILDSKSLHYVGGGKFTSTLISEKGLEPICGSLGLKVSFIGGFKEDKYAFRKNSESLTLNRTQSFGVKAKITSPSEGASVLRYEKVMNACSTKKIALVPISIELTDLESETEIDPSSLPYNRDSALYNLLVKGPDGEETIPVFPAKDGTKALVGMVGVDVTEKGDYTVTLVPNSQNFKPGYTSGNDPDSPEVLHFNRYDSFWVNPIVCGTITTISWLALLAFIGFLVYMFTGGPGGRLIFKDNNGTERLSIPLSTMRLLTWINTNNRGFAEIGLKNIKYSPSRAAMEGNRAILLKVVDVNTDTIFYSDLETGCPLPLTMEITVEYFHPKAVDQLNSIY